jgi:hypothetical protein
MTAFPTCALDLEGRRRQAERYRRVAADVVRTWRRADAILVVFGTGVDRATLGELVAVERECCPFFTIALDEARRRLTVSAADPDHAPALDAIAASLSADVTYDPAAAGSSSRT